MPIHPMQRSPVNPKDMIGNRSEWICKVTPQRIELLSLASNFVENAIESAVWFDKNSGGLDPLSRFR